ncbi:MAG: serine/threonine protein kinase [Acidobacteria bacterium]|nr:serine/threonine protein kinase [Acidobacteriota bacterium]
MGRHPTTIGRYTVEKLLGEGAMGSVYKAHDPAIQRVVAIKTIKTDVIEESEERKEFTRRFFNEAQICGSLHHPNIVILYDLGEEQSMPFIAMEYLEGKTLQQWMKSSKKLDIDTKIHIIAQVADALDYAHERGIIHRDIKPQNVMVTRDHIAKIMDFGIAKIGDEHMTKTGFFVGTPSYSSPEQIAGEKVDYRSDIFSLGVLTHELLTGKLPFPGKSISSILYQVVNGQPSLEYVPPEIDANKLQFKLIFLKVLNKDRDKRFQSATEFAEEMRRLVGAADRPLPKATAETPVISTQSLFYQPQEDQETMAHGPGATSTQAAHGPDLDKVPSQTETHARVPTKPDPVASAPEHQSKSKLGLMAMVTVAAIAVIALMMKGDKKPPPIEWHTMRLTSVPPGAEVFVDGSSVGHTPMTQRLEKIPEAAYRLSFKLEGYEPVDTTMRVATTMPANYEAALKPIEKNVETPDPSEDDPVPVVENEKPKGPTPEELEQRAKLDRELKDQAAWNRASQLNNENAYADYLNEYPKGSFASLARRELANIRETEAYQRASRSSNVADLESFLNNYPTSQWAASVEDRLNQLKTASAFQKAMVTDDVDRIADFLGTYRTWANADQIQKAESRLAELNSAVTEESAYEKVANSSNLPELQRYLNSYGTMNTEHANAIRQKVTQINAQNLAFLSKNLKHDGDKKYKVTKSQEAFELTLKFSEKPPFEVKKIDLVWALEDGTTSQTPMFGSGTMYTGQIPHGSLKEGLLTYFFTIQEASGQVYQLVQRTYTTKVSIPEAPKNLVITY